MDLTLLVKSAINSLYHLSSTRNMRSQHNYRKIALELDKLKEPLYNLCELRKIRCVGDKTIGKIQEFIDKEMCKKINTRDALERCANIVSSATYDMIENKLRNGDLATVTTSDEKSTNKIKRKPKVKEYIPGYRTGGYAILKALWIKEGSTKHGIAHLGRPYCDSDFDFSSRHSAWTSMRTLIRKGLVYREGRSRFYLSSEGRRVAGTIFANTSTVDEVEEVTLVVDSREIKSKRCRSFFQNYFESKGIRHETRVLEVGDFLWVKEERICGAIVERKKGTDFVSSIADGRFEEQKLRLKNCGVESVFYIVEGLKNSHMQKIGCNFVISCLIVTKLEGFIVMETDDIVDTSSVIAMIDTEIRSRYDGDNVTTGVKKGFLDMCEESGDSFEMSYGSFIEKGRKERNEGPTYLFYLSLLSIKGVNHVKADALSRSYGSIGKFIEKMDDYGSIDELYNFKVDEKKIPRKNVDDIIELFLK